MKDKKTFSKQVKDIAQKWGAELVGFAPADELETNAPTGHKPSDLLPEARSVIVVAGGNTLNEDRNYLHEIGSLSTLSYIEMKDSVKMERRRTRACVQAVHEFLIENGYKSVIESHGWSDVLSFKQASYFAGLGVFGKGSFIIHPKFGTINVLGCIVTDAVLEYNKPMDMDLCGDCEECIKACKYGTYKRQGDKFIWNENKCRVYNTVKKTKDTTYGLCDGDCINICPVGNGGEITGKVRYDESMISTLDEIMDEIKPYLVNIQDDKNMSIKVQEIFDKKYLKPINYEGIIKDSGFTVWIIKEELEKVFRCKKLWIEFSSLNDNLFNRIYDLRDILNHEWSILVINEDITYDFYRPLIWSKIQGVKGFVKQI